MSRPVRHGMRNTPEYNAWCHMKYRYGRQLDTRWEIFENFFDDIGHKRPGQKLTRINRNKPFKKGNVKWM